MAITLINSLYPPQFPSTFAPAFPTTASPRIYFSISEYNSSNDIRRVHVSIVNQSNSESAINNATGILFKDLNYDTEAGMYYVDIAVTDIRSTKTEITLDSTGHVITTVDTTSGWNYNQYYKLQLRFDNNEDNVVNNSDYFVTYLENFSEWSQVLLLRPIVQPEILIRPFDLSDSSQVLAVNKGILHLSGFLQFGDGRTGETETMQSYTVEILNTNSDTVLYSSDIIYTNDGVDPNNIDYLLDLVGLDTSETNTFRVRVNITTKNNYTMYKDYEFAIADYVTEDDFNPTVTVDVDKENGIATLHIENTNTVFGTLYVRRSSSVSNFKEWEAIREQTIAGPIDLDIVDNTVGSGIWYRYYCQLENTVGGLTRLYYSEKFFPDFYDAIFSRQDKQIAVRFNYNISNMKPVVNRQKIDTLGGRYPKFAENAAMNYKQFSISGLISTQEDEEEMFLGKEEYFGTEYDNYTIYEEEEYRDQYTIENYNYFWERGFREELVKWLNDGEPKLYRSMTEGLMVVMLTDISLTPNKTLSRRLYDFSATVYEIADGNSLDTLNTLGIYKVITLDNQTSGGGGGGVGPDPKPEYVDVSIPGQLYEESISNIVSGKVDIVSNVILSRLQQKYSGIREDKMPRDLYIKYVKIQFLNKPHLFLQNSSGIYLVDDPNSYSESDRQRMQLGYTFEVNNQSTNPNSSSIFFVNRKGFYSIPDNIDVTSLFFPQTDDVVLVEYVAFYKEANNSNTQVSTTTVDRTVVGQEQGVFAAGQYLGERIRKKYSYVVPGSFYQQMQRWKGICLDVTPFAVANILYDGETEYSQAVVGMTGVLHLLENCVVQDIYFSGRRMNKIDVSDIMFAKDHEFAVDSGTYAKLSDITSPQIQMVYAVGDTHYIYYNDCAFYEFTFEEGSTDIGIAAVNIEGSINYYGDIQRFTYA